MRKRFISIQTILEPYGLVTISGEVTRSNSADAETEGLMYSPFDVSDLTVKTESEILQGWTTIEIKGTERRVYRCSLENYEIEICQETLFEKFAEDDQDYNNALIDEAIERGREYKHFAYA